MRSLSFGWKEASVEHQTSAFQPKFATSNGAQLGYKMHPTHRLMASASKLTLTGAQTAEISDFAENQEK